MRLIEVLEKQTGYLIFIRSNRVGFNKVQWASFAKLFSILIRLLARTFPDFFSGREKPLQNSQLFSYFSQS